LTFAVYFFEFWRFFLTLNEGGSRWRTVESGAFSSFSKDWGRVYKYGALQ
jgi:hypothetical protein